MSEVIPPENKAPHTQITTATSTIPADRNQSLVNIIAGIVMILAVTLSIYQLYTAGIAALTALVQRSIHLGAILSLTFFAETPFQRGPQG